MTQTLNGLALTDHLKWRYATKIFDAAKKLTAADWKSLEDCLILTPSSYGLQPWKFLVIQDPATRQKLLPLSWNQKQVVDCSHYVVFLGRTDITEKDIDAWVNRMLEINQAPKDSLNGYRNMMVGDLVKGPRHQWIKEWAARQVYIALGNLMTSAAMMGIDTCPMEGLDPIKYDEVLNLKDSGFATIVACAVGYRSADDKYAKAPKMRFAADKLIQKI